MLNENTYKIQFNFTTIRQMYIILNYWNVAATVMKCATNDLNNEKKKVTLAKQGFTFTNSKHSNMITINKYKTDDEPT